MFGVPIVQQRKKARTEMKEKRKSKEKEEIVKEQKSKEKKTDPDVGSFKYKRELQAVAFMKPFAQTFLSHQR